MAEFFASGRIVDVVLALTLLEALALAAYHRRTGAGIPPADLAINLMSGVCLMFALRAALTDAGWMWIGAALCAALAGHLLDVRRRWR